MFLGEFYAKLCKFTSDKYSFFLQISLNDFCNKKLLIKNLKKKLPSRYLNLPY